ncbi:ubiquinone biosynthesis protein UbiB [Massilia sp. Root351]|jgi:ubiquinone biosynthesis monooxygenase Coq7|uniref:demethoxyubiquinone hydroxylase family protein n=1 Tax=Massilia sp. Root351 TaxID=1736522 RepID=UPI00070D84DC|nr:demethoxyubiquinone hydroxylase family protein [Massilia sp. Root351]KQV87807.1 ubiquinone biosynthesis protein UbiB [Massilia sp. Root351]
MNSSSEPSRTLAGRILKVNHAGEQGAVCIYAGQICMARWTARPLLAEIRSFKAHEEGHRSIFLAELERRGVMRCKSYWLCAVGGYVLGLLTGLLGARAISLTTVAVERVVLKHLRQQLVAVADDAHAVAAISAILHEEQGHLDAATAQVLAGGVLSRMIGWTVSSATESVIWLGMRL